MCWYRLLFIAQGLRTIGHFTTVTNVTMLDSNVSDDYRLYRLSNTITGITGILSVTQPKFSLPFIHIRTRPINRTCNHYHNNFKFYLQLNVYASLSREWIDLAWLNVMVCVWRSTKTSKIEKNLGFDPTCFQTSSGADECIDIGCWEVPRCHTIPREISAYSDDGHLVRPSLFTLKMSRCRGRVTFKVTQIHSYAFWDYHWPKY